MSDQAAEMVRFDEGIRLNAKGRVPFDNRYDGAPVQYQGKWGIWREAHFDVPASVPDERVQFLSHRYERKFGNLLEKEGLRVLHMSPPKGDTSIPGRAITAPDRRRYVVWAIVTQRPEVLHMDVPDEDVPLYLAHGWKLNE